MESDPNDTVGFKENMENKEVKMEDEGAFTLAQMNSNIKTNGLTEMQAMQMETSVFLSETEEKNGESTNCTSVKEEEKVFGEEETSHVDSESETEDGDGSETVSELYSVNESVSENEGGENSDTEEKAEISLHVRTQDYDEFEETGAAHCRSSRKSSEEVDSIKTHSMVSEGSTDDEAGKTKEEVELIERKSDLHCALCGEMFRDGRLLACLHTFCLECLMKVTKKVFKFFFCPLCKGRSKMPKGGLADLPRNSLVTSLIERQVTQLSQDCVVCKLLGIEKASVAKCVNCGDMLCSDCSGKHTFSRQTARHTVVPMDDTDSEGDFANIPGNEIVYCQTHKMEELKFYCHECGQGICRDCVLLGHTSHQITSDVHDVYEKVKENIIKRSQGMNQQAEQQGSKEFDKYLNKMAEEEERQKQILEDAKTKAMKLIDKKYNSSLTLLETSFRRRRENYFKKKRDFEKGIRVRSCFEENINFLLKHGNAFEIVALEKVLNEAILQQEKDLKLNVKKAKEEEVLPVIKVFKENLKLIEGRSLFRVEVPQDHLECMSSKHKKEEGKNTWQDATAKAKESRWSKSSDHTAQTIANSSGQISRRDQNLTPLKSQTHSFQVRRSIGRGILSHSSTSYTSLLGEYPAHVNLGPVSQNTGYQPLFPKHEKSMTPRGDFCRQSDRQDRVTGGCGDNYASGAMMAASSGDQQHGRGFIGHVSKKSPGFKGNHKEERKETIKDAGNQRFLKMKGSREFSRYDTVLSSLGRSLIHLKLRSSINIRVSLENVEPKVIGIVFTAQYVFALSDCRNKRVKMFDVDGKFLTVVEDERPGSITMVQDLLIWNSQGSDIKVKSRFCIRKIFFYKAVIKIYKCSLQTSIYYSDQN